MTIIILIILSAVTIKVILNSGLITLTENAAIKYQIAQQEEINEFKRIEEMLKDNLGDARRSNRI